MKRTIKIESTNKALSSQGGLLIYNQLISELNLENKLKSILPTYKIETKTSAFEKFKALCFGLISGADCLEDMDLLSEEPSFLAINEYVNASNSYGEYLRKFSDLQCKQLNQALIETSLKLRKASHPEEEIWTIDLDSTNAEQAGQKMEGAAFNYKGEWGLDSIAAFDQFGYQYWMQVRPGSTFTSNNSPEIIHKIFKSVPNIKTKRKKNDPARHRLRADSGFCNADVFNAARAANVGFVIAMRENMFAPRLDQIKQWVNGKEIKFYDGRSVEIGHSVYYPDGVHESLRITVIRAKKVDAQGNLFGGEAYDYCAWVSNIGHHELNDEQLILLYRQRGVAENFIKELKYGFDLKHFPCQKLTANKAYGLIAAFAYNLMRYTAFLLSPNKPQFSKAIRFKLVNLACQVVQHARQIVFRFTHDTRKEVEYWQKTITYQFSLV